MYFLRYHARPTAAHPEAERVGAASVVCWIDRPSLDEADAAARADIAAQHWEILDRDAGEAVTAEDYAPDDEWRGYYEQALTDREVYVFHTSPRFPVFWVSAAATHASPPETAEVHYFLCGDAVADDADDLYDPAFWSGTRGQEALDTIREAIEAEGWAVAGPINGRPCGVQDLPEELVEFYDEAEEGGSCLVFLRDGEPAAE
jgi:hypothetical protein